MTSRSDETVDAPAASPGSQWERQEPIRVRCEGSRRAPASEVVGICAMCGWSPPFDEWDLGGDLLMPEHDRDDVLAMIKRGDFG